MGELRVGCAGWSYRDWVGAVYAAHVPPARWLETYADLFSIVEIDATFYAMPTDATVEGWIQRVAAHPKFTFCTKAPQDLTHRALPGAKPNDVKAIVNEFRERVLEPLETARRLEAVLVQLPPSYALFEAVGDQDALTALADVLELLEPTKRKVAVEFRHGSWYEHVGERVVPEVVETLTGLHVAIAQIDGLGSQFTQSRTTPWTYFRLHGRRTNIPPSERGLSHAPYNYLYTKDEIADVAGTVAASQRFDQSTLVLFNNHYRGQAAHNAMDLLEALGQPRPKPGVTFKRESRLDEFGALSP